MADPILHSVSEPPTAVEVKEKGISSDPRVGELLQAIYTVSRTAATSMNLGKAVDTAKDLQNFVDPADASAKNVPSDQYEEYEDDEDEYEEYEEYEEEDVA